MWALIVAVMGLADAPPARRAASRASCSSSRCSRHRRRCCSASRSPSRCPGFSASTAATCRRWRSGRARRRSGAFEGMESARQFYYNAWYMWVHPPLLFFSYGAFVDLVRRDAADDPRAALARFETTAYRWARLGYLPLTAGMLLGFPWALIGVAGRGVVVVGQGQHVDHDVAALHRVPARAALPAPPRDVAVGRRARGAVVRGPRAHLHHDLRRSGRAQLRRCALKAIPSRGYRAEAEDDGEHAGTAPAQDPTAPASTTSASARGTSGSPWSPSCCSAPRRAVVHRHAVRVVGAAHDPRLGADRLRRLRHAR